MPYTYTRYKNNKFNFLIINFRVMPSRQDSSHRRSGNRPSTRMSAKNASTREARTRRTEKGEDVWEEIMNMKGKGEQGGFNKMNTTFYLKDAEEIDIVLLDENPYMFWGHVIKCQSTAGKTFYRIEQCQKSEQDYCVMCDSDNKAISKAKKIIAFRLLDSRGSWDKDAGGFDGVPVPKIFTVPLYLAKQFKSLKDDAGTVSDKVIKLSKNGNYQANFKFKKGRDGSLRYVDAPEIKGDLPEVLTVYAPMSDDDLIDFIRQFADAATDSSSRGNGRRSGGGSGSFGD